MSAFCVYSALQLCKPENVKDIEDETSLAMEFAKPENQEKWG